MGDLKPCPFCGSNRHKTDAGFRGRFVMCLGCFCQTRQKDDDESAIAAWNLRATPPEVTALVEALKMISEESRKDNSPLGRSVYLALATCGDVAEIALATWDAANA